MSVRYIGYQLAYATWGFIIQSLVLSTIVVGLWAFLTMVIRYNMWWLFNWVIAKIIRSLGNVHRIHVHANRRMRM
jgi:hypothetical protein